MDIKKNFNTINIWIKINFRSSIPEAKISSTLKQKPIRLIVPIIIFHKYLHSSTPFHRAELRWIVSKV